MKIHGGHYRKDLAEDIRLPDEALEGQVIYSEPPKMQIGAPACNHFFETQNGGREACCTRCGYGFRIPPWAYNEFQVVNGRLLRQGKDVFEKQYIELNERWRKFIDEWPQRIAPQDFEARRNLGLSEEKVFEIWRRGLFGRKIKHPNDIDPYSMDQMNILQAIMGEEVVMTGKLVGKGTIQVEEYAYHEEELPEYNDEQELWNLGCPPEKSTLCFDFLRRKILFAKYLGLTSINVTQMLEEFINLKIDGSDASAISEEEVSVILGFIKRYNHNFINYGQKRFWSYYSEFKAQQQNFKKVVRDLAKNNGFLPNNGDGFALLNYSLRNVHDQLVSVTLSEAEQAEYKRRYKRVISGVSVIRSMYRNLIDLCYAEIKEKVIKRQSAHPCQNPECSHLTFRGKYCSDKCSKRVRDTRYLEKHSH